MSLPESHPLFPVYNLLVAEEARWAEKVADEVAFPEVARFGRGYVCRYLDTALRVRTLEYGSEFIPVTVDPLLLGGFSRMTLAEATRVAEAHPGDYRVEHVSLIATNRLREIRETLAALDGLVVEAVERNDATA